MEKKKIVLGISGASGVVLGYHLAKVLAAAPEVELHMVISDAAKLTWECETDREIGELIALADTLYDVHDMAAQISSGSFRTAGMIIAPCSMKTLAGVVTGYTDNLLLRAADVCMKEGRKLVICPREMPLGRLHLRNLSAAAELGCVIIPPMLSFYSGQATLEDQLNHIAGKILMQFALEHEPFCPWKGRRA